MIDALKLAELPRDEPLTGFATASGFKCVIRDCSQEPHAWRVKLPQRAGLACTACASDAGFTIR